MGDRIHRQPMARPAGVINSYKAPTPTDLRGVGAAPSAATTALLGLALVLLNGRFVVT